MFEFSELIIPCFLHYIWGSRVVHFRFCVRSFLGRSNRAAGIGGVVLVPLLVYGAGYGIHISIAAAVSSFYFFWVDWHICLCKAG